MTKKDGITEIGNVYSLSDVAIGTVGVVIKINADGKLRRRILDMGLTPNTQVYLRKKAPLGDPIEITIRGYELTLRKEEASQVEIKVTDIKGV